LRVYEATYKAQQEIVGLASSSLDAILSLPADGLSQELLFECIRVLKPNGYLTLHDSVAQRTFESSQNLQNKLTLAGFTNTSIGNLGELVQVKSFKPNWEMGTSNRITIKNKTLTKPNENKTMWNIDVNDDDIIDEDSLISEQDLEKPSIDKGDCEVGSTKKACKNCSCGRVEMEQNGTAVPKRKLTLEMLENPGVESSCGSCGLGDAFRCRDCPYMGLPAFKPGNKIKFPDNFVRDEI